MKEMIQNLPISKTISRRTVLGGIVATAAMPAAGKKCKGYGSPQKSNKFPNDDAYAIRANFALWLLISTSEQFFPIDTAKESIAWSDSMASQKLALVTDLCNLPGNTPADKLEYIQSAIDWLNSGNATFPADVAARDGTKIQDATVTYVTALAGIRQFFSKLSLGFPDSTGKPTLPSAITPAYTGHECPRGSREVLSVATENPTALVPSGD